MARLTRKNIKVFAGNSNNNGVFGSLQANNPTLSNDVEVIQSLSAWGKGWDSATETSEELPPIEEMNSISYVTTYQQAYLMQEGMPEWSATVTFYKGSLTKEVTSTGFRIYCSLADDNLGNLLSDTTHWKKVMNSDDLYAFDSTVVKLTGNQTIAGTKTFSSSPIIPTPSVSDNTQKGATTAYIKNVLNAIYPVGSVYMGTNSTCPLAAFFGTWTLKSSGIVTSVDSTVAVAGNGKALGLIGNKSDGTINTVSLIMDSVGGLHSSTTAPESQTMANNPSPAYNSWGLKNGSGFGVSTDTTKSGLVGTASSATYTVNIWERTA